MTAFLVEARNVLAAGTPLPMPSVSHSAALVSAKMFLQSRPFGVYTCARARTKAQALHSGFELSRVLVEWSFHLQRLSSSLVTIATEFNDDQEKLETLKMATKQLVTAILIPWQASETMDGMLSILWYPLEESDDYGVAVHICPMVEPKRLASTVLVHGEGRQNARCKHTQWIEDREPITQHMMHLVKRHGEAIDEVLLSKAGPEGDRFLLEGLITNFFVVKDGQVYTAGEGILEGSTRQLVLKACRDLSIPVVLEAPKLSERKSWQAAFVTSAVRVVIDVTRLLWEETDGEHLVVRETFIPSDRSGYTQRIRDQISMQNMYLE